MNGQIERLEEELTNIQHEMNVKHFRQGSLQYQVLMNRQNWILGFLACARGEMS